MRDCSQHPGHRYDWSVRVDRATFLEELCDRLFGAQNHQRLAKHCEMHYVAYPSPRAISADTTAADPDGAMNCHAHHMFAPSA